MLQLHLNDPVALRLDGEEVKVRSRKQLLLLAVLAEGPRRREELAEIVWEHASAADARASLRNALSSLKRCLPVDLIVTEQNGISLNPGMLEVCTDSARPFMPGFDEAWALNRRVESTTEPAKGPLEIDPLVGTFEWMLERNPDEALQFLCATRSFWEAYDVHRALDVHERALLSSTSSGIHRLEVEGHKYYLQWIAGRLDPSLKGATQARDEAVIRNDHALASKLSTVIAYGLLSRGRFDAAVRSAQVSVTLAESAHHRPTYKWAAMNAGVICLHANEPELFRAFTGVAPTADTECDNPSFQAQIDLEMSCRWVQAARYDDAQAAVDRAMRYYEASHGRRMVGWSRLALAEINLLRGDLSAAEAHLRGVYDLGPEVSGHSLIASTDEMAAKIYFAQQRYDEAAFATARTILFRRQIGAVPSLYEQRSVQVVRDRLKARLTIQDRRRAFERARVSLTNAFV